MRVSPFLVATAAVLGLLAGCSGPDPEPAATPPASLPSATSSESAPGGPAPSSGSPGPSSGTPTAATTDASAADGKLTWVMPCGAPRDQDLEGNAEDKKTYAGFHAWACGEGATAKAGVIVAELQKAPADDAAAQKQLNSAMAQIAGSGKPTPNTFLGHPGITEEVEQNGRTAGYQGVSFDRYLAFFFVFPSSDLATLTDTISIG